MNKTYTDLENIVQTTHQAFRDDFPGSSLSNLWSTPVITGAATATISSSNLVLSLSAASGDSVTLTSRTMFTVPCRFSASLLLSARSANQEIIVELVSESWVVSGGTTGHYARWKFDGTTATSAKTQTRNTDTAGTETTRTISTTAATTRIYNIDLGYDDVRFSQMDVDSTGTRPALFIHTVKIPNAVDKYYIRISARNTGASSALTATFDFLAVQDVTEVMAEIISGTGFVTASQAIPVTTTGTTATSAVGSAAHDAAVSGNPVRIGGRGLSSNYATVATGDTTDLITTLIGSLITKPYSIPEAEFAVVDQITNSATAVQIKAATASNKNYVTGLTIASATLGGATDFMLRSTPIASTTATIASNTLVMAGTYNWKVGDLVLVTASTVTGLTAGSYYYILTVSGANLTFSATRGGSTAAISGTSVSATLSKVIFRTQLQTTALPIQFIQFATPLDGGTGLAIEACEITAVTGRIDFNVQGYVAP